MMPTKMITNRRGNGSLAYWRFGESGLGHGVPYTIVGCLAVVFYKVNPYQVKDSCFTFIGPLARHSIELYFEIHYSVLPSYERRDEVLFAIINNL